MQKVKFKKSVIQGKKPSSNSLEYGEIAINYNAKTPFLSFQTSGDTSEIVQIAPTQSYFVKGTQTSATNAFTGELLGISELKSGLAIDYWLPYNGTSSPATLNLTISDSTGGTKTTGAIAVYAKGTTRVTTHYTASNVIHMVYTKEGGTNGRTEGWWVTSYYDTNTDSATTYNGHYTPSSSETKTYSASAGQYITGITLQRDGKGHVTGITGTTSTLSDKDSYISAAAFSATAGNVTMSLTRTGSTTGTVTATIPVANSGTCGVVKIITGDLQSKNYTAGEAAAAAHTHSQYSLTGHTHSQYSETGHTHAISSIIGGTSGYIAKSQGASSAATWVNPTALTVGVANKLGTTTVGSTIKPIFISGGTPTAITSIDEALLAYGTTSAMKGSLSAFDMAVSDIHSANRLAFGHASGVTIEYSTNGGTTWADYGASDSMKVGLISGIDTSLVIGKKSNQSATTQDQLRITLKSSRLGVYTRPQKLLIYLSTNGAAGSSVKMQYSKKGTPDTYIDTDSFLVDGWSGWNSIPLAKYMTTFGGGSNQTTNVESIRLTFSITGTSTTYNSNLTIHALRLFGTTYWTYPSTMAKSNHIYTFDTSQNTTFPAEVTATKFNGPATKIGTATVGSTTQPVYISSGTPTACSFTIPANPLFTDSATTYAGHYTPSTGNSPTTAVTTGDALSFGNAVITGIKRDGKGHILSVTTQKLPNNPNTDSATTYDGHYTPSSSETKTYSASTGQYLTGISLQRDGKGHVTGITGTTATDKDSYISAAAFSATTSSGVTMSLTRTGSTTGTVTATIPAANTTSYGVVHSTITSTVTTGYSVCPIIDGVVYYKDTNTNTDSATTYDGHYTPSSSETKTYSASTGQYLTGISLQRDGKGHVTGITGTTATLSDKDSYINAATFSATTGNVKMTLTRTGSTTGTVTADIPAATSAACGVVKIITGDLQSKKYTAGEAAAAAHTHSQYSETGHTHSQYSLTGHTHSTYLKNPTASTTADTIYIVGIKTGATQTGLYDSGVTITNASVKAKNGFFQTSDERLKTFTKDIEVDLDKLSELPKKKYYWTEDKDKVESIGTSAQKVRELFPEVVNVNEDGYLSVDYAKLSIVALAAIDELNKKNKLLEERLERLEKALLK